MKLRSFWLNKVEQYWQKRPVIWLSGVRRAGKTVLASSLSDIEYFDCEIARTRFLFEEPFEALRTLKGKRIVLDEIHRLPNPSELLKIAHDYYPDIRVLATGSSSLGVSDKFKDTLTGRKLEIWLTPMNFQDLVDFEGGTVDLKYRLLKGGLPAFFLSRELPELEYQEWMASYWSRDIQELFRLERRSAFLKLVELLFVQSGSIFEASRFAAPCEINRQTVTNYLSVMEATHLIHIVRPFTTRRAAEITSAAKTYAFDTGFVCYFRGWTELHAEELGPLWEHLVLNELQSFCLPQEILYWRDKRQHEIDFVISRRGKPPDAIECKWRSKDFDSRNLAILRSAYPDGRNFLVASDIDVPVVRHFSGLEVTFIGINHLKDFFARP
jgi:uncharacterized protein